ncbi:MAG: hypothetical protein ABH881_01210 [bacterium]
MKIIKYLNIHNQEGIAMLFITIVVLASMLSLVVGNVVLVRNQLKTAADLQISSQAYYAAESGIEDAMYRLKNGMNLSNPENLQTGVGSSTVIYTNELDGSHILTAIGGVSDRLKKIVVSFGIVSSGDAAFNYGAQAGEGGMLLQNGSIINGNVFSNGSVKMENTSVLTETMIVAQNGNNIEGAEIGGDAYVDHCKNSNITGVLYCNTHDNCTADSIVTPLTSEIATASMPISDEEIAEWKDAAEDGGITSGDLTFTAGPVTLGPQKIVGNLIVRGSAILTMNGTIWVTGDLDIEQQAEVKLSNGYSTLSGVLIVDGVISLDNTAKAHGTEQPGSYLVLLSTALGEAISLKNQFQGDILYTTRGEVVIRNSTNLKEVTGYRVHLENSAELTYESGVANLSFSGGPGGAWDVRDWKEVE